MAAYAALVSLMNDLELIPNHPIHSFSFHNKQITSLSQTVHFLVDFMESYDSHGCNREAVEVLESRIASVAHAAHDVIESHVVDQIHAGSTLDGKAAPIFLPELQKAIDDMNSVKRETMQFQTEQPTYSTPTSISEPLMISHKNVMVGFDAVLVRLMEMLIGKPSHHRSIIPIVGMAGTGKTTLAINAYQHFHVEHHFDHAFRLWATISHEYSVENILMQLLNKERKSNAGWNVSGLGEELHKKLWGRRYLVVLDDMWSMEAWDKIQMFLPDNGNGSRVIVTTRLSSLATSLSSSPFEMNFLDEDKSWELFCGKVFGKEECPVELEKIGKKIVERCIGLPLSIVVIGGQLRRSPGAIEYWEKVANIMNPISSLGVDDQCLGIISLSYEHLPARLKPCFLYMSILREDEKVYASELLKFWVAEGFLKAKKGFSLEEVAEEYLEDLIDRNLILVHQRSWNGTVEYCVVHDTVRELCLNVAKKQKFMRVLEDSTQATVVGERRIVLPEDKPSSDINLGLESGTLVRSLIRQRVWFIDELCIDVELRSLRLLRLSSYVNNVLWEKESKCFPAAHLRRVNLRHLAFSSRIMETIERLYLPSSFWNMQTLVLKGVNVQITAPYEIWEMSQLRHIELDRVCLLDPLPSERSNQRERIVLKNLHSLLGVLNFILTEEVCKRMPNIKNLLVSYDNFHSDREASSYYHLHNLYRFNKLESLKCEFGIFFSRWRDVILSFRFPSSIRVVFT